MSASSRNLIDARRRARLLEDPLVGACLLGAAANVVMQMANPRVGRGVVESRVASGQLLRHPVKRTRTTLAYLAVALDGTDDERRRMREAVDAVHRHVHSTGDSPVTYDAFDPFLQLWVAACLYRGLEDTLEALIGPLTADEKERLYARSAPLGTTLQVPASAWPRNHSSFEQYWASQSGGLGFDDDVRRYLRDLIDLRFLPRWIAAPIVPFHRFVTAGFLPRELRDELGLRWDGRRRRRFGRLTQIIGSLTTRLPRPVRRLPFNLVLVDLRRRIRLKSPLLQR